MATYEFRMRSRHKDGERLPNARELRLDSHRKSKSLILMDPTRPLGRAREGAGIFRPRPVVHGWTLDFGYWGWLHRGDGIRDGSAGDFWCWGRRRNRWDVVVFDLGGEGGLGGSAKSGDNLVTLRELGSHQNTGASQEQKNRTSKQQWQTLHDRGSLECSW